MNRGVANGDVLLMLLKMTRGITMMNKGGLLIVTCCS